MSLMSEGSSDREFRSPELAGTRAGEVGVEKLRGVVRRRTLPILATGAGVLILGALTIWQVKPGYKASAILRVVDAQPAKDYVPPTVGELIGERLKSLRLSVMSRPVVAEAATRLQLYAKSPKLSHDDLVEDLRSRMDVKVEGDDTFLLTYVDSDAARAKAVVNTVAQVFSEQQVAAREKMASATTQALRTEAAQLKPQVDKAEAAVRSFKLAHYGSLPEQQEGNLRTLDQTTMELNIQSTNLDMDLERRRQMLAAAMSPLRQHEEQLAQELYEARTKYTEDNPEVKGLRNQYQKVKTERVADEKELMSKARRNNPELVAIDGEITRNRAMIAGLRDRQKEVRQRVDDTAKNGQQLAGLSSTYDSLEHKYQGTMGRLRDAELAEGLEHDLGSMRYELVEGAVLPRNASSPNRPLMAVGLLLLAAVLGLGVGFALDAADGSIRYPEQLRTDAGAAPILACIPHFDASAVKRGAGPHIPMGPKAEA